MGRRPQPVIHMHRRHFLLLGLKADTHFTCSWRLKAESPQRLVIYWDGLHSRIQWPIRALTRPDVKQLRWDHDNQHVEHDNQVTSKPDRHSFNGMSCHNLVTYTQKDNEVISITIDWRTNTSGHQKFCVGNDMIYSRSRTLASDYTLHSLAHIHICSSAGPCICAGHTACKRPLTSKNTF